MRHYNRDTATKEIEFKSNKSVKSNQEKIESPYDLEARFRTKRDVSWTGYVVNITETCDQDATINVITHVRTTPADVHEINSLNNIQDDLAKKGLSPKKHLVDSGYVSARVLLYSKNKHGIDLIGPLRGGPSWREKTICSYN